ncbi:hypothetical protein LINPERPRIM_LOCUS29814, partial [Linum perenne]
PAPLTPATDTSCNQNRKTIPKLHSSLSLPLSSPSSPSPRRIRP